MRGGGQVETGGELRGVELGESAMSDPCFFLNQESIRRVNALLELPASGREQDWEVELADPARRGEFFGVLTSGRLAAEPEAEAALAALYIGSSDDAIGAGVFSRDENAAAHRYFQSKPELRDKMLSLWFQMGGPANAETIRAWLTADLDARGAELFEAVERHDVARVAYLLGHGASANASLEDDPAWSVLCAAVLELKRQGPMEPVVLLLRSGAATGEGLLLALTSELATGEVFARKDKEPALSLLLAAGADPNYSDATGWSPLLSAVRERDLNAAATLLRCGATRTIDRMGVPPGTNPLGLAVGNLDVEMVKLLLDHGADPLAEIDLQIARDHLYEALPGHREKCGNPGAWDVIAALLPRRPSPGNR